MPQWQLAAGTGRYQQESMQVALVVVVVVVVVVCSATPVAHWTRAEPSVLGD
jgi:hypothetical protein